MDRDGIRERFRRAVNMSADELEAWLETPESRRVGQKTGDGESIGHAAGRRLVRILRTPEPGLNDADWAHMRKAAAFVARHRAQEPENIATSRWRYALMNWGFDPLKE
jgi:predicted NAD/FAD-dependent oxidoreductase